MRKRINIFPGLFLMSWLVCDMLWAHDNADYFKKIDATPILLRWTFPPLVTCNLALLSLLYAMGVRRLWLRAGVGRGGISRRQALLFASGIGVLVLALLSPIDALSDELSSVHMIQHMLLMAVAAPLLVMGGSGLALLWLLPLEWRRSWGNWKQRTFAGRWLAYLLWQPLGLWLLFGGILWIWHLPPLYEATLHHELFHDFQHFTFVIVSCLFWRVLLDPISRLRLSRLAAVLYLFLTTLHATLLGVFMTLAPMVWYPTYIGRTDDWQLTALEDQQLAGLIMWMPACTVYALIAAVALVHWLESEPRSDGDEQRV